MPILQSGANIAGHPVYTIFLPQNISRCPGEHRPPAEAAADSRPREDAGRSSIYQDGIYFDILCMHEGKHA